ncbi:MAG TPA: D-aminoacyl-tRNA deacylase [Rubrobacteraceae bacterium]|nr:D-aminoacyl-tRNA deacylase [Rubrobacteraceae bacterium]
MKIVLQRVKNASVSVDDARFSEIGPGLLLLVGVATGDTEVEAEWLAKKVAGLRVFNDAEDKMNLSIRETSGEILAVSQFTLLADTRKGKRPSFVEAAPPVKAEPLFEYFCEKLRAAGVRSVKTGSFGAMMDVALTNDGPVTVVLER